jgi:hypothetical protein
MGVKIYLMEETEPNTEISWWNTNREKLNSVIRSFNDWQIVHRFDDFQREVVKAKIDSCRRWGHNNEFSDWQFDELREMEEFIQEYEKQKKQSEEW